MTPESRILIEKLLRQELERLGRDRQSATLLAVTYCPRLPLAEGVAAVLGRIDVFTGTVRTALAEITGIPTDDL